MTEGIFRKEILTKKNESVNSDSVQEIFSMKFPKPKLLTENEYPDLDKSHPKLLKELVQEIVHPAEGSKMSKYYETTVQFLKEQKKSRAKKALVRVTKAHARELGKQLHFVKCATWGKDPYSGVEFSALVDTGAANSLVHIAIVERLGLAYQPIKLTLCTATGRDETSIKGMIHLKFALKTRVGKTLVCCTNFIVTSKLNGLQSIIGAEFLFDDDRVQSISKDSLKFRVRDEELSVEIFADRNGGNREFPHLRANPHDRNCVNMLCKDCGNATGPNKPQQVLLKKVEISHSHWLTPCSEITAVADYTIIGESAPSYCSDSKNDDNCQNDNYDFWYDTESDQTGRVIENHSPLMSENTGICDTTEQLYQQSKQNLADLENPLEKLNVMSHSVKEVFQNETLPPSEQMFDDALELKFEVLDKN